MKKEQKNVYKKENGIKESIREFAFRYRALCLRLKPIMSEKDIIHAILRNCKPRIASVLRGTVYTVDELVRLGTLVERDLAEEKVYWKQVQQEAARNQTTRMKK